VRSPNSRRSGPTSRSSCSRIISARSPTARCQWSSRLRVTRATSSWCASATTPSRAGSTPSSTL